MSIIFCNSVSILLTSTVSKLTTPKKNHDNEDDELRSLFWSYRLKNRENTMTMSAACHCGFRTCNTQKKTNMMNDTRFPSFTSYTNKENHENKRGTHHCGFKACNTKKTRMTRCAYRLGVMG